MPNNRQPRQVEVPWGRTENKNTLRSSVRVCTYYDDCDFRGRPRPWTTLKNHEFVGHLSRLLGREGLGPANGLDLSHRKERIPPAEGQTQMESLKSNQMKSTPVYVGTAVAHSQGRGEIGEEAHSGDFLSSTISPSVSGKICRVDIRDHPLQSMISIMSRKE